jgi:uncharacterized protein with ATP-grasp and redox domains
MQKRLKGDELKATADCIPCIENYVLKTAKHVSEDDWLQRKVLLETMDVLRNASYDRSPPEICYDVIKAANRMLGVTDPYREVKENLNRLSIPVAARAEKTAQESDDPLLTSLKFACAANALDVAVLDQVEPEEVIGIAGSRDFEIDNYEQLKEDLEGAKTVFYLLDNAGEIAFDKLVVQQLLDKDVTCVVRRTPVLNDATREDAEAVSLSKLCNIVDPGADFIGLPLDLCSGEFRETFDKADVIIAKGMANFETLEGALPKSVYFLLMAKCPVVAGMLGVKIGDMVLLKD